MKRLEKLLEWADENRGKTVFFFIGVVWLIGLGYALAS